MSRRARIIISEREHCARQQKLRVLSEEKHFVRGRHNIRKAKTRTRSVYNRIQEHIVLAKNAQLKEVAAGLYYLSVSRDAKLQ